MTPITTATIAPIDSPTTRGTESGVGVDASKVELLRLVAVEEAEVASEVLGLWSSIKWMVLRKYLPSL